MLASVPLESFLGTGVHAGPEGTGEGAKLLNSFLGALPPPFTPLSPLWTACHIPPPHTFGARDNNSWQGRAVPDQA